MHSQGMCRKHCAELEQRVTHPHKSIALLHFKRLLERHDERPVHVTDGVELQVQRHVFSRFIELYQVVLQRHQKSVIITNGTSPSRSG